ncbi:hypothetical protein CKAH01_17480 [Colletotrichum kahawae]|uniref:Uncharacterized protein n=1 Tax=Colletotrichum kahawae TaxID=34407 RepID=A0AAD9YBY5_COLKA|nr:hypothetical protein CKAH01_17480 [Colletotrichum kahawae]
MKPRAGDSRRAEVSLLGVRRLALAGDVDGPDGISIASGPSTVWIVSEDPEDLHRSSFMARIDAEAAVDGSRYESLQALVSDMTRE